MADAAADLTVTAGASGQAPPNIQQAAYEALAKYRVLALSVAQDLLPFEPKSTRRALHRLCELGCASHILLPIGSAYYIVPGAAAPGERRGKWPRRA